MESTDNLFKKLSFFPEPEFQEEILNNCKIVSFKKGDVIGKEGRNVKFLPIVIEGAFQQKEDREILLYYVRS